MLAAAEMAFAGGLGASIDLDAIVVAGEVSESARAFAETPSRYLLEVKPDEVELLRPLLGEVPFAVVGEVTTDSSLRVVRGNTVVAEMTLEDLHSAWAGEGDQ